MTGVSGANDFVWNPMADVTTHRHFLAISKITWLPMYLAWIYLTVLTYFFKQKNAILGDKNRYPVQEESL